MSEKIDLTGQVAIVTGGGRGIGRAIAQTLAGAGAAVTVVTRSEDQLEETVTLIKDAGGRAIALPADVTDVETVTQVAAEVEKRFGPVDLLVNNAGIGGPGGPMWEADVNEWWRCLDINLRGPFLCSQAVLPGMVALCQGKIVNVASNAGLGTAAFMSAYGISKAAVIRFSEILAVEVKAYDIGVFAIHPGFVHTAMVEAAAQSPIDEEWLGGLFRNALAEGWNVPPEKAAQLVLTLASGKADALSGCYITINDDLDEMISRAEEIRRDGRYTLRLYT